MSTQLTDEELLHDAEQCWKNAFKLKGDSAGIQAVTLVSIAASLLILARNTIKEHKE